MDLIRFLDEIAFAGPEHLDPSYVRAYSRKAGIEDGQELEELHGRGLASGSALLDFGAGTGGLAVVAASLCRRVVAFDP